MQILLEGFFGDLVWALYCVLGRDCVAFFLRMEFLNIEFLTRTSDLLGSLIILAVGLAFHKGLPGATNKISLIALGLQFVHQCRGSHFLHRDRAIECGLWVLSLSSSVHHPSTHSLTQKTTNKDFTDGQGYPARQIFPGSQTLPLRGFLFLLRLQTSPSQIVRVYKCHLKQSYSLLRSIRKSIIVLLVKINLKNKKEKLVSFY